MAAPRAGLYGKLPARGDFVLRHLGPEFVSAWDAWISGSIVASSKALGSTWLQRFLMAPPWRFALAPGIVGTSGWLGVMVTSADAVGRAFPLTVAAELPPGTGLGRLVGDPGPALARMERLALSLIEGLTDLDRAGAAIAGLGADAVRDASTAVPRTPVDGAGGAATTAGVGWATYGRPQDSVAVRLTVIGRSASFERRSLWWHEGWRGGAPCTLVFDGLPAAALFPAFLPEPALSAEPAGVPEPAREPPQPAVP